MTTVLQYLVIAAVIGLILFGVALLVFGRGERLSALPARTSPAQLPERGIDGSDVRQVRFALALRGYRMSDVDWTLERLADELDRSRAELAELTARRDADPTESEVSMSAIPAAVSGRAAATPDGIAPYTSAVSDPHTAADAQADDLHPTDPAEADPHEGDPATTGPATTGPATTGASRDVTGSGHPLPPLTIPGSEA